MLTGTRGVPHGMLPAPLRLQRARPKQRAAPVRWGRERPERGGHLLHHDLGIPLARTDPPQRRPRRELWRQGGPKSLQRSLPRLADQRHGQPAAHQTVLGLGAAEVVLARVQHLIDCAGDACAIPHVSRSWAFWDVGCIQKTPERFFFQAFSRVTTRPMGSHPSLLSYESSGFHGRGELAQGFDHLFAAVGAPGARNQDRMGWAAAVRLAAWASASPQARLRSHRAAGAAAPPQRQPHEPGNGARAR
jgi:hypothetical protein